MSMRPTSACWVCQVIELSGRGIWGGGGVGGAPGPVCTERARPGPEALSTWAELQEWLQQESCRKALLRRPLMRAGGWEAEASQD